MKNLKTIGLIGAATLMMQMGVAHADMDAEDILEMKKISEGLGLISLEEAQKNALLAKPGIVEDADLEDRSFDKGWDYEFEILDADGNEWEVLVDAKTGEVRDTKKDWF
ncbi:MAG TPA: peptidase M4 [Methylophaga aminisulfidivorans]|uniref:Peptidase M4 n=2 Tax=root TaxID=1 RepID=A0A7C1W5N4_9GAMM|nr:peptidase M4 [Methylophaga aminisulfidivorans]